MIHGNKIYDDDDDNNHFGIIIAIFPLMYRNVYQFTCTVQKEPDTSEGDRLLQNCGSSVLSLL